ncbi:MAG: HAMP domain-containing histidine kinase [Candidatus Hydrogenedentes bacterium]|nr:HAMP domain-containing histidine kinase [Candidatus Hydrogenedentota bacterium]
MTAERSAVDLDKDVIEFVDVTPGESGSSEFSAAERSALDAINQRVASGETLDAIMNYVFEATQSLFPCDRIGLSFLEDEESRVVAYWVRADYGPLLLDKGYAEELKGSSLASVFQHGSIRIIHDLERYLDMKPASISSQLLFLEGVRSSMTSPLTVEGRRVGFLFRSSRKPWAYDRRQVMLQAALVERLGQAVEKAYRIEQLEAANRAYRELLSFVSHEVKNPVASIAMDARVLTGGYLGELTPEQARKIDRIIYKAEHVLHLTRDYLDLTRLDIVSAEPHFHECEDFVAEVIEPAIEIGASQIDERRMCFHRATPATPLRVSCEPELMRIAVANLLSNAIKYGLEQGEVRLTVDRCSQGIRTIVWNKGPGFPESEQGRLFRRFSRLQTVETKQVPGTGIGLYTVWRVARLHGGFVTAKSEEGSWAEFALVIPQPPGDPNQEVLETILAC